MADNIELNSMSGGSIVATDDISNVHYQIIKLAYGALDAQTIVSTSNGLPVALLAGTAAIGKLAANDGVDIGDVTINNASGASAVNIQDGGNSITVDIGDLLVDNAGFTDGASKVMPIGFIYDEVAGTTLTENDIGAPRMDAKRAAIAAIEDANVRGRRAVVDYQGRIQVSRSADGVTVSGNVLLEQRFQPINVSSNGAVLISGMANRRVRVLNGVLMAASTVKVNIKNNNNTDLTGPLNLGTSGGFQVPHADLGNFESEIGANVTVSMDSNIQVGGWLTFVYI